MRRDYEAQRGVIEGNLEFVRQFFVELRRFDAIEWETQSDCGIQSFGARVEHAEYEPVSVLGGFQRGKEQRVWLDLELRLLARYKELVSTDDGPQSELGFSRACGIEAREQR